VKISYLMSRQEGLVVLRRHTVVSDEIVFERITEDASRAVRDHSPRFDMGYICGGAQQLGLAILLDVTGSAEVSETLSRAFMLEFLTAAAMPIDAQVIEYSQDMVRDWAGRTHASP